MAARDGQIAGRSAYVAYFVKSTTGITDVYLASPSGNPPTGALGVDWVAIGLWQ